MIGNILSGQQDPRQQMLMQQQPQISPQMQIPAMMAQQQQPIQFDPYGQQTSGVKAALLGRYLNGSI